MGSIKFSNPRTLSAILMQSDFLKQFILTVVFIFSFVCVAVLDRLGESDILCQFVETQEKVVERHKYETRGHVEGTVDELHVSYTFDMSEDIFFANRNAFGNLLSSQKNWFSSSFV